jgi:hypothetical protein
VIVEGTDPVAAESRICEGHWPYAREEVAVGEPGQATPVPGDRFQIVPKDQFGDRVDLNDFLEEDTPIVADESTAWCPSRNDLASRAACSTH